MTVVISLNQPLIDDGPKQVGRLRENALQPESAGGRRHRRLIASFIFTYAVGSKSGKFRSYNTGSTRGSRELSL
jgi:hypothetical protein